MEPRRLPTIRRPERRPDPASPEPGSERTGTGSYVIAVVARVDSRVSLRPCRVDGPYRWGRNERHRSPALWPRPPLVQPSQSAGHSLVTGGSPIPTPVWCGLAVASPEAAGKGDVAGGPRVVTPTECSSILGHDKRPRTGGEGERGVRNGQGPSDLAGSRAPRGPGWVTLSGDSAAQITDRRFTSVRLTSWVHAANGRQSAKTSNGSAAGCSCPAPDGGIWPVASAHPSCAQFPAPY